MAKCQLCGGKLPLFRFFASPHVCRFAHVDMTAIDSDFSSIDATTSPFHESRQFTLSAHNDLVPILNASTSKQT